MLLFVAVFLASSATVVVAGTAVARFADAIADSTRIGRLWIGAVLLAGATSLPELVTDLSAVRLGVPDLAVGDLFGSSMANMLILALIDLLPPRRHVLQRATLDHALSAALAISLNAVATLLVVARPAVASWVGPGSVVLFLGYIAGTRAVYRYAMRGAPAAPAVAPVTTPSPTPLRRALFGFCGAALVILLAAPLFAWSAKGIADLSGLGNTFVGTWLVGFATSLPELVACIAAVRMGSFDLAVGTLFGSNAFNMAIFFVLDLAQPGNLFAGLDPAHALSGLSAVVLMSIGLAAIVYRVDRPVAMIEPDSLLIVATYAAAIWLLYQQAAGL